MHTPASGEKSFSIQPWQQSEILRGCNPPLARTEIAGILLQRQEARREGMETPGYKHIENRFEYTFTCPIGVWRAHLDAKAWGTQRNLLLYFSELGSGKKYVTSVFLTGAYPYQPAKGGVNFKTGAEPGDCFELETGQTKTGKSKLVSAVKL
jgi:hypothetical protein